MQYTDPLDKAIEQTLERVCGKTLARFNEFSQDDLLNYLHSCNEALDELEQRKLHTLKVSTNLRIDYDELKDIRIATKHWELVALKSIAVMLNKKD